MVKTAIRLAIRLQRRLHRTSSRKEKDRIILSKLTQLAEYKKAQTVLFYAPIPREKEVDTWPAIEKALDEEKVIVLPKINIKNKTTQLYIINGRADTIENKFHIPEPAPTCQPIKPEDIDLVIIPGVAFDKQGNRLGFGHGFYDRLLKKIHGPKVALAYSFQILHAIPRHEHDVPVTHILTEKKIHHTPTP